MPQISIIANFYKSENFIPQLIQSVINQSYQDWELICVNDCSPMNDLEIINYYAKRDSRIIVISNPKNLGISKSKFEGIKKARGKYLMFIDGDDWLENEALERCVKPAEKYDIDMVIMSSQKVLLKGFIRYKRPWKNKDVHRIISQPELFDKYYINFFGINLFSVTYWGKLIRKDAIDRACLSPSDSDYSEDEIFNMMLFPHLKSMYMIDYIGYNWRWGGITSGRLKNTEQRQIRLLSFVLNFYDRRMALLNYYKYEKAKRFLTIELVNYLIEGISSVAHFSTPSNTLRLFLIKYLQKIKDNQRYISDMQTPKYLAVFSNSADELYSYCHSIYKKNYCRNQFKTLLHHLVFG